MTSLYIDTSHFLTLGLLDNNKVWENYSENLEQKSSGVIHHLINEMLESLSKKPSDVSKIYLSNGPGSYTGVRVGEGIGQIFEWQNVKVFSFHHYLVPKFAGFESGVFICSAFKGEYFVYEWSKGENDQKLVNFESLENICKNHQDIFSNQDLSEIENVKITTKIIHHNPSEIFENIEAQKLRLPPFYFRKLSDEFKKKSK